VLTLGAGIRVFALVAPVDMRGSFDALAGAARRLGLEPVDGHLYLFLSRNRRLCRAVWFDGSGWCLFSKRLTRGTFELPPVPDGANRVIVDAATLGALLQGIDLTARRRQWYRRGEKGG
jgi:transposase